MYVPQSSGYSLTLIGVVGAEWMVFQPAGHTLPGGIVASGTVGPVVAAEGGMPHPEESGGNLGLCLLGGESRDREGHLEECW